MAVKVLAKSVGGYRTTVAGLFWKCLSTIMSQLLVIPVNMVEVSYMLSSVLKKINYVGVLRLNLVAD